MLVPESENQTFNQIKHYLPEQFRTYIEENFYARVSEQAHLEYILKDQEFLTNPVGHIALYSDHGIVHVRDVASQIISVLNRINGQLIPHRDETRLDFMRGYGVAVAYLHDIGMCNLSPFGRRMHPEFAAQEVFKANFEDLINRLWDENSGNLAWRLLSLSARGLLAQNPANVLREMLALSICHSKSKVPIEVLNDCRLLRQTLQKVLPSDLHVLFYEQKAQKIQRDLQTRDDLSYDEQHLLNEKLHQIHQAWEASQADCSIEMELCLKKYYQDFEKESFRWLVSPDPKVKELVKDVLDTLRALRCADALRQRGTSYKTSGGYEVFVDQHTANAIYALRNEDHSSLYLLEAESPINAGEANISSCEIDRNGNLRVSFHRGAFSNPQAIKNAVYNAALVINDVQGDAISSFNYGTMCHSNPPSKDCQSIEILVEHVDDNEVFASLVCEELERLNPEIGIRSRPVVSLQGADLKEVERYLNAQELDDILPSMGDLQEVLQKIARSGHKIEPIDMHNAFREVKVIELKAEEVLIEAGSPSGFVYVPFGEGMRVHRLGGYTSVPARAWVPLGNTGVIRGSIRNANVVAECHIHLLVIPKQVYLNYWYHPYSTGEFTALFKNENEEK